MQEQARYAVGLDIGTTTVRCVIGHVEDGAQVPTIIGLGQSASNGMRKGTVVDLAHVAQAVDKALEDAERMSGHHVNVATISVNGTHVIGMSSKGVVAVGAQGHEISEDDLARVEEAATVLQLPANREILEVAPRNYQLDGQDNIKDPVGMTGVRLEVDAYVITALTPHIKNVLKILEMTQTATNNTVLDSLASARAVLTDQQIENGVALIDIGGATTNIAVYEEGDLQHIAVLPVGGINITNDLAIGLKTDLDVAEKVKLSSAVAEQSLRGKDDKNASVKVGKSTHEFDIKEVDEIVEARLEEIFEQINKELKSIGRAAKLPGGVVLTGGTAELKGIEEYAKKALQLAARVGKPSGFSGVAENVNHPAFASALGLMLLDAEDSAKSKHKTSKSGQSSKAVKDVANKVGRLIGKFRS